MLGFTRIVQALFTALITLISISAVIFALTHATGSPVNTMLAMEATQEQRDAMEQRLGLDKPFYVQYGKFLGRIFRGDFGKSIRTKAPVVDLLKDRIWKSLWLGAVAVAFAVVIAVPLGVMAAVHRGGFFDRVATLIALIGQSIPPFFTGILAILIFSVRFDVLPSSGSDSWKHVILPGFALGWFISAGIMRLLRSSMLEVLDSEYIKLARAKGVSEFKVIWKHSLRNSLVPVVTFIGFIYGLIIGAAVTVELVFGWSGLGRLVVQGTQWRDFPLVQAVVIIWAAIVLITNLAVDMAYAALDPRVRR